MSKPVAWMLKTGHGTKILEVKPYCEVDYWIPLYTHPANVTYELTMEKCRQQQAEIEALKADNQRLKGFCWETDEAIEFLKSVKKAQENEPS